MEKNSVRIIKIEESSFKSRISKFEGVKFKSEDIYHVSTIDIESIGKITDKIKKIQCRIKVEIYIKQEDPENLIVEFETSTRFEIKGSKQIKITNGKITFIDNALLFIIISTSIGATRGMLSYKLASMPFDFILPILDVGAMLEKQTGELS